MTKPASIVRPGSLPGRSTSMKFGSVRMIVRVSFFGTARLVTHSSVHANSDPSDRYSRLEITAYRSFAAFGGSPRILCASKWPPFFGSCTSVSHSSPARNYRSGLGIRLRFAPEAPREGSRWPRARRLPPASFSLSLRDAELRRGVRMIGGVGLLSAFNVHCYDEHVRPTSLVRTPVL